MTREEIALKKARQHKKNMSNSPEVFRFSAPETMPVTSKTIWREYEYDAENDKLI